MNTTIQIKKETLEKLKMLKEIKHLSSYDDLINNLINEANKIPKSMFGFDKGKLKKFNESDRIEFRDY